MLVRLQSIELENFKNIEKGRIEFISYKNKTYYENKSEIIGIYGQNGSGKTAIIQGIRIVRGVMMGHKLSDEISNLISQGAQSAKIASEFYVELDSQINNESDEEISQKYLFKYLIEVNSHKIIEEKLFCRELNEENQKYNLILNYENNCEEPIFEKQIYEELIKYQEKAALRLAVSSMLAEKESTSFIFKEELIEILEEAKSKPDLEIKEEIGFYHKIITGLREYAREYITIITSQQSMPLHLLGLSLQGPGYVDLHDSNRIQTSLGHLNVVLGKIIPSLYLELANLGKELGPSGEEKIKAELISCKKGIKVPLKYESEGIRKIISMLSSLILVYNDPSRCLIIDEFDAGIYEYLLGEIVQILEKSGKGQLLFTSHNLRPLEMLGEDSIIFSTTDKANRFIRLSKKGSKNLRIKYLRGIDLGGLEVEVYDETSSFEIAYAFRKAGELNGHQK